MKRRSPFNELKDMGYKFYDEPDSKHAYERSVPLKTFDNAGRNPQVYLQFELMDFKYVNFDNNGKLKNSEGCWDAENIVNGKSPECYLKILGECSEFQSKVHYAERQLRMKKEIKKLRQQVKEIDKEKKDVEYTNSKLSEQLQSQFQQHQMLVDQFNKLSSFHNNLKSLLKAIAWKEESKQIEVTMDMIKRNSERNAVITHVGDLITVKLE